MRLTCVILKNFYNNIYNDKTKHLFGRLMALKVKGYRNYYPEGVMPLSTVDFLGDHLAICYEKNGDYIPLISYRSISLDLCQRFNVAFPLLELASLERYPEHHLFVREQIKIAQLKKQNIIYNGPLTYDRELCQMNGIHVEDQIRAMHSFYHHSILNGSHLTFACGTVRFKMERYFHFWGYEYAMVGGQKLEPMEASWVHCDLTNMYIMKKLSNEAVIQAKRITRGWTDIIIEDHNESISYLDPMAA